RVPYPQKCTSGGPQHGHFYTQACTEGNNHYRRFVCTERCASWKTIARRICCGIGCISARLATPRTIYLYRRLDGRAASYRWNRLPWIGLLCICGHCDARDIWESNAKGIKGYGRPHQTEV